MSQYPEHDKAAAIAPQSQTVGEFLDWLHEEKELVVAEWDDGVLYQVPTRHEKWLAEFFQIDLNVLEAEKRTMLDAQRKLNDDLDRLEAAQHRSVGGI